MAAIRELQLLVLDQVRALVLAAWLQMFQVGADLLLVGPDLWSHDMQAPNLLARSKLKASIMNTDSCVVQWKRMRMCQCEHILL